MINLHQPWTTIHTAALSVERHPRKPTRTSERFAIFLLGWLLGCASALALIDLWFGDALRIAIEAAR